MILKKVNITGSAYFCVLILISIIPLKNETDFKQLLIG